MAETKEYRIKDIESLTEADARKLAKTAFTLCKDHELMFIDFGGYFGFSCVVFRNGRQIRYANEYELHWRHMELSTDELRGEYIKAMRKKLFTDAELMEPVKDYGEYRRKDYFLRNYWIMQYDYASCFFIGSEKERAERKKSLEEYEYFNSVSFCYMKDKDARDRQFEMYKHLKAEHERLMNTESYFREAVATELSNHEAGYTGEYEEGLNALGLKYEDLDIWRQRIVRKELEKQEHNS